MYHKAMTYESRTMIFGGYYYGSLATEIWEFGTSYTELIPPVLDETRFVNGFGMYLVDINFCKIN